MSSAKRLNSVGSQELLRLFLKNYKEHKIHESMFRKIISTFHSEIKKVLLDGKGVRLHKRIGVIKITGKKYKSLFFKKIGDKYESHWNIDWAKTHRAWERNPKMKEEQRFIKFNNLRTEDYTFTAKWNKKNVFLYNKKIYFIKLYKTFKTEISKEVVKNYNKFELLN